MWHEVTRGTALASPYRGKLRFKQFCVVMRWTSTGVQSDEPQGFQTERAAGRGREQMSVVGESFKKDRQHEGEGVHRLDEVAPAEPGDRRRSGLRRPDQIHHH